MSRPPILLIGWQTADWKLLHPLLDAGAMPNLQALISHGVMGTLNAPSPLAPELLWPSLATGRRASGHGILSGRDSESSARSSLASRNCPAFWDVLKIHDLKSHLINWPLTIPAENTGGVCVSDTFFDSRESPTDLAVYPQELDSSLAQCRVDPKEVDTETILFFVPGVTRVAQKHDDRLRRIARSVARTLSVQAVTTWLMENQPADVTAVRFDLLADLASWALPLTAPKLEVVGRLEFDLYRHVLDAACRTLDLLLGTLVRLAGPHTLVALVSDHGLLLGAARPVRSPRDLLRAASWRRQEGILVFSGAGCHRDRVIFGAKLLDVVPTLLASLGVSLPAELEGRVLGEAFTHPVPSPIPPLPIPWPARPEAPSLPLSDASDEVIEQKWNLARSLLDANRVALALDLLEKLHIAHPYRLDFLHALFESRLALKNVAQARETLALLLDHLWATSQAALLQARLEYAARRFELSLRHLESIEALEKTPAGLHLQIGLNLIKLNQSARARASFSRELEIQPDSSEARAGLAYCSLRAGEFDQAIEHAVDAVSLNYQLHHAHFLLGLARARKGETENALAAFRLVTTFLPEFGPAHRCLSVLYSRDPSRQHLARHHQELARSARHSSWGF
jgi:tetratricopeptide (TPR) repeat protein